jgi:ectoine hydroxylase-related dioxygenase (phytanoyl-CoA dioxygenase family)
VRSFIILSIVTIQQALESLQVSPTLLSDADRTQLDEQGFLKIPDVLSTEQLTAICDRLDAILAAEGEDAGKEVHQEPGTDRMANLVNKGAVFDIFYTEPKVLAAISHVLGGDLKLSSLNARFAKPGEGLQSLHADWGRLGTPGDWQVCNSIWLLDDFTPENGATRAVPGSHRWGSRLPGDDMPDPSAPHPEEALLLAPAGTVFVFNSHTWHGGTLNRTAQRRRACHSYFTRRGNGQQLDQRAYFTSETASRISEAAKVILDV